MNRQWQVRRTTVSAPNGQQRWDHAYQLLLRWVITSQPGLLAAAAPAPLPCQEVCRARSTVCPGLDQPPGPAADD
jgi:hypothetical protein